jgi:hypothetical protein
MYPYRKQLAPTTKAPTPRFTFEIAVRGWSWTPNATATPPPRCVSVASWEVGIVHTGHVSRAVKGAEPSAGISDNAARAHRSRVDVVASTGSVTYTREAGGFSLEWPAHIAHHHELQCMNTSALSAGTLWIRRYNGQVPASV